MSTSRTMQGGYADPGSLPKGPNGRNLCRWCNLEVPKGRITFCSQWCVNEWRLRNDPGYLREQVFARDKGICARCGADTQAAWNHLRRLPYVKRRLALAEWGLRGKTRSSLWDAPTSSRWSKAAASAICQTSGRCASSATAK